ncbi:class I SAM-dependent methyltransferase [Chamaesiphon sp. GL140_3_metabinner_50]|uniref:class I SAM-dependent methyltransferase n=1 Tax=Chamaesiphon sp. GL140_3_metabinner_50 TaxID=2970812 RepID=UPI0025DD935A|nr:class I SAM-dependent methyltransferase [Chamaesiphon sp. GL140_3_metabinner_50]
MNIYSQLIFPNLIDKVMSDRSFSEYRKTVLADAVGDVLEIGFGTGLNLAYYPAKQVNNITTIDINTGMNKLAQKRIAVSPISVNFQVLNGENLPMEDDTFDTVVSTWTLCSIKNLDRAIAEIYRVLKPGGKFLFIEHGLSNEPNIQTWQHRITPIQKFIGEGCHLDRDIKRAISQVFDRLDIKEFYAPNTPKIGGYFYQGVAIK